MLLVYTNQIYTNWLFASFIRKYRSTIEFPAIDGLVSTLIWSKSRDYTWNRPHSPEVLPTKMRHLDCIRQPILTSLGHPRQSAGQISPQWPWLWTLEPADPFSKQPSNGLIFLYLSLHSDILFIYLHMQVSPYFGSANQRVEFAACGWNYRTLAWPELAVLFP